MTDEELRQLHNRSTNGEDVTPAEISALQIWYDENDKSEDLLLNPSASESDSVNLNEQLNEILAQVSNSAAQVKKLARQNTSLKRENETLRRAVENQLLEKAV